MKLYLSSYRIPTPKDLFKLVGKPTSKIKAVIIPNAKDYYAKRARQYKIQDVVSYFNDLSINPDILDLRRFTNKNELLKKLQNYDLLWVTGGNTFCLRYEMKRSGFDKIIIDLLNSGLVYAGESAGALITGPTLKGVELADQPEFAKQTIYQGLGVIKYYIMPHIDNPVFSDLLKPTRLVNKTNPNYLELKDSEAYIIDDDKIRKVSR